MKTKLFGDRRSESKSDIVLGKSTKALNSIKRSSKEQLNMIICLDKRNDIVERQLGYIDDSSDKPANALSAVIKRITSVT